MYNNNEDVPMINNFPDEYIFAVSTKTPWSAYIVNYFSTRKLPPHLSVKEKQEVIKTSAPYSWIDGEL